MRFSVTDKDDCIGKYQILTYRLSKTITYEFYEKLCAFGDAKLHTDFPRPYFCVKADDLMIKGIIGEDNFEATYFYTDKQGTEAPQVKLEDLIKQA